MVCLICVLVVWTLYTFFNFKIVVGFCLWLGLGLFVYWLNGCGFGLLVWWCLFFTGICFVFTFGFYVWFDLWAFGV